MKIKFLFITISLFIFSCNSDETTSPEISDSIEQVSQPEISSLSKEFLIEGDTLTIEGRNFVDNNFETKLIINNEIYDVTPISNTQINIAISNSMGFENNSVVVKISDKISESKDFFTVPKGWYKIETDAEIIKAFLFDDSNSITTLVDTQTSSTSFFGDIVNFDGTVNGYQSFSSNIPGGNKGDLLMLDSKKGVTVNNSSGFFTSNSFGDTKSFGDFLGDGEIAAEVEIKSIDDNSSIIVNCCSAHIYTNDGGETYNNSNASRELFSSDRLRTRAYGKGSDNYFYEIGVDIGQNPFKNYVIKSANGFNNWELVSNSFDLNLGSNIHFFDSNLIFSLENDEFRISTDLTNTWNVIRTNVQSFFIKNESNWFIVSDNKLYATNNSGINWNLELELPTDSEVNYMSFTPNKMLIAGKKLLHIKHE